MHNPSMMIFEAPSSRIRADNASMEKVHAVSLSSNMLERCVPPSGIRAKNPNARLVTLPLPLLLGSGRRCRGNKSSVGRVVLTMMTSRMPPSFAASFLS